MPQIPRLGLAGISGIGQSSSATQTMFSRAGRSSTPRKSRGNGRSAAKSNGTRRKKKGVTASAKSSRKSKKGKYNSAAWMAKIRRKRGR